MTAPIIATPEQARAIVGNRYCNEAAPCAACRSDVPLARCLDESSPVARFVPAAADRFTPGEEVQVYWWERSKLTSFGWVRHRVGAVVFGDPIPVVAVHGHNIVGRYVVKTSDTPMLFFVTNEDFPVASYDITDPHLSLWPDAWATDGTVWAWPITERRTP